MVREDTSLTRRGYRPKAVLGAQAPGGGARGDNVKSPRGVTTRDRPFMTVFCVASISDNFSQSQGQVSEFDLMLTKK